MVWLTPGCGYQEVGQMDSVFVRLKKSKTGMLGLGIFLSLFVFCFVGGLLSPYDQDQVFYRQQTQLLDVGFVTETAGVSSAGSPLPQGLLQAAQAAISKGEQAFSHEEETYYLRATYGGFDLQMQRQTLLYDSYALPSRAHPLGTDKNGMDILTRLMYGGRVSLVVGVVAVAIALLIGTVLGGIAGFFGGFADGVIMRLVDVFFCIPSLPILLILGAAMDKLRLDATWRLLGMMAVLGLLGWPEIARLVRGQLLSLREQEFMLAALGAGLPGRYRLFHHLLPNVVPQLIVVGTLRLGGTILTEATLSFLGLGVKFPYASWGNMVSDVTNAYVLTTYYFVWIPAGICLVLGVLGFHLLGDGLRDAFDPKEGV